MGDQSSHGPRLVVLDHSACAAATLAPGMVYDSRIFTLPEGANLGERLHAHILAHPVGREIFGEAKIDRTRCARLFRAAVRQRASLWRRLGRRSATPPVSSIRFTVPGLDFCSYTSYYVSDLLRAVWPAKMCPRQLRLLQRTIPDHVSAAGSRRCIKDKYYYMGDAELMSAALLLDVGTYFIGLVIPVYNNPGARVRCIFPLKEKQAACLPA